MDIVGDCSVELMGRIALFVHGICTCTPYEVDERSPSLQTITVEDIREDLSINPRSVIE